jgi:dipeptidyl-peptidase-4
VARRDGRSAPVKVDLGPTADIYIYQVAWSEDGSTLYVERQSRDQKRLDLLAADPATGASRVLVSETSSTWVDLELNFRPLRGGYFLWGSSRTGWRHLYLYDRNGTLVRPVTAGPWRVARIDISDIPGQTPIVGVDEDKRRLYFIASIDTPLEQQLYSISYAHPDTPRAVTRGHGWWQPIMAQGHPTAFVGRYSEPEIPPRLGLYDLDGRRIAWLAENRLDANHPMFPYLDRRPTYEDGVIKAADGQDLHYLLVKPAGFDPRRHYPAVIRVYGGPEVQTVRREWHSAIDQLFTQAGYVMFRLDNRGSGNRSEAFEHAMAGHFGEVEVADQITGVGFLRSLPFVDPDRIGIIGSSFGGYVGARAVMTPGSGLRAAVASSTPAEWRGYDTHYTEQYLGQPKENAAGYDAAALLPLVGHLEGKLMLMHGVSDDNVSFSNFTALVTALEAEGKPFEMSIFPEQGHEFIGAAAQARAIKTSLDFLQRALAPAGAGPCGQGAGPPADGAEDRSMPPRRGHP